MQPFDRLGLGSSASTCRRSAETILPLAPPTPFPSRMMQIHQLPGDRQQLIFRIRRQIAENTYDTPEKLEIALDRLVDSLGAGDHDDEG